MYNLLYLNLYYLTIHSLTNYVSVDEDDVDLITDLKRLERVLFSKLDPSIRYFMRKQGISISNNTYVGFDTEFTNIEVERNSLVSVQLAVTSQTYLKIPKNTRYTISKIDVDRNKVERLKPNSAILNYTKIENSIQRCIQCIKDIKYGNYEECMFVLNTTLKNIKGFNYYDDDEEYTLFRLPRSAIQPYICFDKKLSLKELLQVSSSIANPNVKKVRLILMNLITNICTKALTVRNGKDKLLKDIYNIFGQYCELEELALEAAKILPPLIHKRMPMPTIEKKLSREYLSGLFNNSDKVCISSSNNSDKVCISSSNNSDKVCISSSNNYYLIAHLTQADLSMLSDFEVIKEDLSIVNGSFVTLRDPLKYCDKNIHVRDTMLLAPGGSKSLSKIGSLYGDSFSKIEISKENLNDMQRFLQVDKEKFIEYALRDALISLIHAL
jgi:hypothetical protein